MNSICHKEISRRGFLELLLGLSVGALSTSIDLISCRRNAYADFRLGADELRLLSRVARALSSVPTTHRRNSPSLDHIFMKGGSNLRQLLLDEVKVDYEKGALLDVDGWIVTETEGWIAQNIVGAREVS